MEPTVRRVIGVFGVAGVAVAAGVGLAGAASSSDGPPPTTVAIGEAKQGAAIRSPLAAHLAGLLGARDVEPRVSSVRSDGASWDDVDLRGASGAGDVVTIYHRFDRGELDAAGLRRVVIDGGTAWIGAEDADLTSVYVLSKDGVGVWVGRYRPNGDVVAPVRLAEVAAQIAADPLVAAAAKEPS